MILREAHAANRHDCVGIGTRPAKERRSVHRRSQSGFMLEECLVYISILVVLFGLSFSAFYRILDNATRLRRSAADIARVLQSGEGWRADIRRTTGPVELVTVDGAVEQALHVPQSSGEIVYFFTGTNVLRRTSANAPWVEALAGVKSSRIIRDARGPIAVWRWELELNAGKKKPGVRPLFTFLAVAPAQPKP